MVGAIIGAAASVGSAIAGGINAAKTRRKMRRDLQRRREENLEWYNRNYNEDATLRADAQALINRVTQDARARTRNARGVQNVIGGTGENLAATENANSGAIANTASNIAARAAARKDNVDSQYRAQKNQLEAEEAAAREQHAQEVAQATSNAIQAAGNVATAIDDLQSTKKKKADTAKITPIFPNDDSRRAAIELFRGTRGNV